MSEHGYHGPAHGSSGTEAPQGIGHLRDLPDDECGWDHLFLPDGVKELLVNHAVVSLLHRGQLSNGRAAQHGLVLLEGPPGTGKTTAARGLADAVARRLETHGHGDAQLVELDAHELPSDMLGQSQRNVVRLLLNVLPELAGRRRSTIVLIDEIEAFATSRHEVSFETNPADMHRATDAVLWGLDRLVVQHPEILFVGTTNFARAVDAALVSRAGLVVAFERPDRALAGRIAADTLQDLADEWPDLEPLAADEALLDELAQTCEGWDGRRIRGIAHTALAVRAETALDPRRLQADDVRAAARLIDGRGNANGHETGVSLSLGTS